MAALPQAAPASVADASATANPAKSRGASSRWSLARDVCLAVTIAVVGPAFVLRSHVFAPRLDPLTVAIKAQLAGDGSGDLRPAYALHGFRPIWISHGGLTPSGRGLLAALSHTADDGLQPAKYQAARLAAEAASASQAGPDRIAAYDVALSRAFASYVVDLHTPAPDAEIAYTDPLVTPTPTSRQGTLLALVRASSIDAGLSAARHMNPIYDDFRRRLAAGRAGDRPPVDARPLLLANLERARALPADLGQEYILVDAAAQRLWLIRDDVVRDSMEVVVGKTTSPTPLMAGVIRYAVFNPYWNVPPDLTRYKFAPRIAANRATLTAVRLQVLTDSTPSAQLLDPDTVDWRAVADGAKSVWLRQLPGPDNMMGRVKFMLPNRLGIYLHDTPEKALFRAQRRTFSSGCVRLQDAARLAAWLLPSPATAPDQTPERPVDLPKPIPVYIDYFTVAPSFESGATRSDVYGRDAQLIAQLRSRQAASSRP